MWTSSRFLQNLRTAILTRSASYVPSKRSVSTASSYSVAARSRDLFASSVVIITESATTKDWATNLSNHNPTLGLAPPSSAASDSEDFFDTTIVLRRDLTLHFLGRAPLGGELAWLRQESAVYLALRGVFSGWPPIPTSAHLLHHTGL